jgi:hypothetical protein
LNNNTKKKKKKILLGLIRLNYVETLIHSIADPLKFDQNYKQINVYKFDNHQYLVIDLKWINNDLNKYYNVYITIDSNHFTFIGSTTIESYKLCLKMNKNILFNLDTSIELNFNKKDEILNLNKFKFSIFVHAIDKCQMANLFVKKEEEEDSLFKYLNENDICSVEVNINNVNCNEIGDGNFFDKIIYDFECFNFN